MWGGCGIGCDYNASCHCQAKNSPGAPSIQCTHVDQPYQGQHGGNQFPYGGYPQQQP